MCSQRFAHPDFFDIPTMSNSTDVTNAVITWRKDLTDDLAIMHVKPDSGTIPDFIPGQFCTIALPPIEEPAGPNPIAADASAGAAAAAPVRRKPKLIRRSYSIASSCKVKEYVEVCVTRVPMGKLTPRLWDLGVGGRVYLDARVVGEFTLNHVSATQDLVMLATGTGITPYISMLRSYLGEQPAKWKRFIMIHGARQAKDLCYKEEFEAAAKQDPTVIYVPSVTREPEGSDWKGLRGRIDKLLVEPTYSQMFGQPLDPRTADVFLCGNPDMINTVEAMLVERGFVAATVTQPGTLHYEKYW